MKEKILLPKNVLTICSSSQRGQKMTKVILDLEFDLVFRNTARNIRNTPQLQ